MKILFAGDTCPFDAYSVRFDNALKTLFSSMDHSFVNLECPLTDEKNSILKCGPALKALPQQVQVLKELGITGVTLANNHVRDYGGSAVMDTIEVCRENALKTVGAGADLKEARRILFLKDKEINVAVINVAEWEFSIAGENKPGANPLDLINVIQDLEQARTKTDKIILVVHGGLEYVPYPSPESCRLLRFLAEQIGVIAVIRHHPHVIQGMEFWRGVPIYYSLGNFYFPRDRDCGELWHTGLIVELEVNQKTCIAHHYKTHLVQTGTVCNVQLGHENGLPSVSDAACEMAWREVLRERSDSYLVGLFFPWTFAVKVLRKLGLCRLIRPTCKRVLPVHSYVHCLAHLECLREMIERLLFVPNDKEIDKNG